MRLTLETPQWTAFNFIYGDSRGRAAVVEYAGPRTRVRWAAGGVIAATNHYLSPSLKDLSGRGSLSGQRYARVLELLGGLKEAGPDAIDPRACQSVLATPGCHQRHITLWSSLMAPLEGCLYLAPGRPDKNGYRRFSVAGPESYNEEMPVAV